ncbi:MAG TPA: protein kinase, partial [Bacillota bacterium]|nr:protein kinase [Bacillota bacterium]
MIGEILGNRYEIKKLIGEGGMALVYLAQDLLLDRPVAIKLLRSEYSSDQEFVERFQREAKSAAKLCHPNVVNIYDVGETENSHYIVMEYIDGISLKDLIKKEGMLSVEDSLKIAEQICSALDHAHKNLIVHRDIKPHNIMITKQKHVKVMDFGIARAVSSATITRTGVVLGSVHYFSPEQA